MTFATVKHFSMVCAIGTSTVVSAYAGWLYSQSRAPDDHLLSVQQFVVVTLLAIWLVADAKESRRVQPSFDYGWYVLILFPLYTAYYLVSTRRWRRGVLILVGMILLCFLPWLAEWVGWLSANNRWRGP
jgi:hypothetical protein